MKAPRIAMLGAFPPQTQGVQNYAGPLVAALGARTQVTAIGFRRMYPPWLFPGVQEAIDLTWPAPSAAHLDLRLVLNWYNPAGWIRQAVTVPCDVFHAQWWSLPLFPVTAAFVTLMRLRGKPIVLTLHNVVPHEPAPRFELASDWLCRRADRVLVHGEVNRQQAIDRYGVRADAIESVPYGAEAIAPVVKTQADARALLGLPAAGPLLLFFGIIRPYKGLHDLLDAFARIAAVHPGARLVIAGKPWEEWGPYASKISERGLAGRVITRLGYVPQAEVPLYYRAADAAVLPYAHFDSQSGVGNLSIAHGLPTLVTRTGALPDWVDNEPDWVVPPADPVALAASLDALLRDLPGRTEAFRRLAARVQAKVSWEHVAQVHRAAYARVLGES